MVVTAAREASAMRSAGPGPGPADTLLRLVSHGNAVLAELLRLKNHVPPLYSLEGKDVQQNYQDIIMDFSYFKISDLQEKKINSNSRLQDLDDDIKETNLELISRFYLSFESVFQYVTDLNLFIDQLNEEVFIQQNIETVMQDGEGKQLLCEALYLYGTMLLICDLCIPGPVRERLLVAFYRYSTSQSQSNVDDVCKLLRDTGYQQSGKRPADYPQEYFSRVLIKPQFVEAVIGKLRSEDVYNQLSIYPLPEHRSTALATQASMLFVCLFFSPQYIQNDMTKMREIVDKFFPDNWVISIYMGVTLSIVDYWQGFKAAKTALTNTCNAKTIKTNSDKFSNAVLKEHDKIKSILKEGTLTEDVLLDNTNKIINILRESNVSLRWLILHTCQTTFTDNYKKSKQLKELVSKESNVPSLKTLELLISTAELELKVRELLTALLNRRTDSWINYKKQALDELNELSELLSGPKPVSKIPENEQLKLWFDNIAKQIASLGDSISTKSTNKVVQLIQALDEVEEFHGIKTASSVLQSLSETKEALRNALRTSNLREESLVTLEIVADVSYAWCNIDTYTKFMQDSIKVNPAVTSRLRALFLKLASAMEIPLLRINQAHSEDLMSVSQYYSHELVIYIQKVLQVIPEMVFSILEKIIDLQTWTIKEVPTRLEKERLREFAQLDHRMEVARLTHSASTFTKGILDMRTTLVGVVRIDPAELLEAGLLKELARHINAKLEELLEPQSKKTTQGNTGNLLGRLQTLADSMDGYKRSLEYIQDYINIHGLKIWQTEICKIISESVGKEVSARKGVALHSPSAGFMGSLARQIAQLTDARNCTYIQVSAAWFDCKAHTEVVNNKTFAKLNDAIGSIGLHGLDTLYAFMIKNQLQNILNLLKIHIIKDKFWTDLNKVVDKGNIVKDVDQMGVRGGKVLQQVVDTLVLIGTLQTLRKHIAYQLNTSCKFDSGHLESSLRTMNEALINELKIDSKHKSKPRASPELLHELEDHLVRCGLYEPYEKIYVKNVHELVNFNASYIIMLVVSSQLTRLQLCANTGDLITKRAGDNIDGHPLLVGAYTFLRQYREDYVKSFVDHLCNYTSAYTLTTMKLKPGEIPKEIPCIIRVLEQFCHLFKFPFSHIESKLPIALLTLKVNLK